MNKKLKYSIKLKVFAEENRILSEKIKACFAFMVLDFYGCFSWGYEHDRKQTTKLFFTTMLICFG